MQYKLYKLNTEDHVLSERTEQSKNIWQNVNIALKTHYKHNAQCNFSQVLRQNLNLLTPHFVGCLKDIFVDYIT